MQLHIDLQDRKESTLLMSLFPYGEWMFQVRLREKYRDPSLELDLVSCQFSFHYCFESLPSAECMLRNAAECLRPGGFFIGTIPDAYEIM